MRNSKLRKQIDACFLAASFSLKRIAGRPFLLRLTALATCLFFTTTNVTWGQPAGAVLDDIPRIAMGLDDLKIPEDMGSIQFTHQEADTDKFVLYVQDAHGIFDAQENIRRMIEYFREKYGVDAVAVEGSKGGLDPTLLRSFPDEFVKKKVMNQYKELGELSGADMAAILNPRPSRFYGIEDWRLYEENFAAYVAADENREEINKKIEALKQALDQKRPQIFSVPLNRFHEKTDAFHEEKSGMFELLKYLVEVESRTETGQKHITPEKTPHLAPLLEAVGKDDSGQEDLDAAIHKMADFFKKKYVDRLPYEKVREFNKHYQNYVTGAEDSGSFLKFLVDTGKTLGLKPKLSMAMKALMGQTETLSMIKGTRLFEELEAVLDTLEKEMLTSPEQVELAAEYKRLRMLKNLAALEFSREQLLEYQKAPESYLALLGDKRELITPALEFYRAAVERDGVFIEKVQDIFKKEKSQAMIVLAGGFHSQGLEQNLKDKKISYAVIMPKMSSMAGHESYVNSMTGTLSYKAYLKTTFYDALMRHASIQMVKELPEPEFKRTLKLWRDQIIRQLSDEGRVGDAGQYTKYIDELFRIYKEKFGDQIQLPKTREEILKMLEDEMNRFRDEKKQGLAQKFESGLKVFMAGLAGLSEKNQLTEENVLKLAGQSKAPSAAVSSFKSLDRTLPGINSADPLTMNKAGLMTNKEFHEQAGTVFGNINAVLPEIVQQVDQYLGEAETGAPLAGAVRDVTRVFNRQANVPVVSADGVTPAMTRSEVVRAGRELQRIAGNQLSPDASAREQARLARAALRQYAGPLIQGDNTNKRKVENVVNPTSRITGARQKNPDKRSEMRNAGDEGVSGITVAPSAKDIPQGFTPEAVLAALRASNPEFSGVKKEDLTLVNPGGESKVYRFTYQGKLYFLKIAAGGFGKMLDQEAAFYKSFQDRNIPWLGKMPWSQQVEIGNLLYSAALFDGGQQPEEFRKYAGSGARITDVFSYFSSYVGAAEQMIFELGQSYSDAKGANAILDNGAFRLIDFGGVIPIAEIEQKIIEMRQTPQWGVLTKKFAETKIVAMQLIVSSEWFDWLELPMMRTPAYMPDVENHKQALINLFRAYHRVEGPSMSMQDFYAYFSFVAMAHMVFVDVLAPLSGLPYDTAKPARNFADLNAPALIDSVVARLDVKDQARGREMLEQMLLWTKRGPVDFNGAQSFKDLKAWVTEFTALARSEMRQVAIPGEDLFKKTPWAGMEMKALTPEDFSSVEAFRLAFNAKVSPVMRTFYKGQDKAVQLRVKAMTMDLFQRIRRGELSADDLANIQTALNRLAPQIIVMSPSEVRKALESILSYKPAVNQGFVNPLKKISAAQEWDAEFMKKYGGQLLDEMLARPEGDPVRTAFLRIQKLTQGVAFVEGGPKWKVSQSALIKLFKDPRLIKLRPAPGETGIQAAARFVSMIADLWESNLREFSESDAGKKLLRSVKSSAKTLKTRTATPGTALPAPKVSRSAPVFELIEAPRSRDAATILGDSQVAVRDTALEKILRDLKPDIARIGGTANVKPVLDARISRSGQYLDAAEAQIEFLTSLLARPRLAFVEADFADIYLSRMQTALEYFAYELGAYQDSVDRPLSSTVRNAMADGRLSVADMALASSMLARINNMLQRVQVQAQIASGKSRRLDVTDEDIQNSLAGGNEKWLDDVEKYLSEKRSEMRADLSGGFEYLSGRERVSFDIEGPYVRLGLGKKYRGFELKPGEVLTFGRNPKAEKEIADNADVYKHNFVIRAEMMAKAEDFAGLENAQGQLRVREAGGRLVWEMRNLSESAVTFNGQEVSAESGWVEVGSTGKVVDAVTKGVRQLINLEGRSIRGDQIEVGDIRDELNRLAGETVEAEVWAELNKAVRQVMQAAGLELTEENYRAMEKALDEEENARRGLDLKEERGRNVVTQWARNSWIYKVFSNRRNLLILLGVVLLVGGAAMINSWVKQARVPDEKTAPGRQAEKVIARTPVVPQSLPGAKIRNEQILKEFRMGKVPDGEAARKQLAGINEDLKKYGALDKARKSKVDEVLRGIANVPKDYAMKVGAVQADGNVELEVTAGGYIVKLQVDSRNGNLEWDGGTAVLAQTVAQVLRALEGVDAGGRYAGYEITGLGVMTDGSTVLMVLTPADGNVGGSKVLGNEYRQDYLQEYDSAAVRGGAGIEIRVGDRQIVVGAQGMSVDGEQISTLKAPARRSEVRSRKEIETDLRQVVNDNVDGETGDPGKAERARFYLRQIANTGGSEKWLENAERFLNERRSEMRALRRVDEINRKRAVTDYLHAAAATLNPLRFLPFKGEKIVKAYLKGNLEAAALTGGTMIMISAMSSLAAYSNPIALVFGILAPVMLGLSMLGMPQLRRFLSWAEGYGDSYFSEGTDMNTSLFAVTASIVGVISFMLMGGFAAGSFSLLAVFSVVFVIPSVIFTAQHLFLVWAHPGNTRYQKYDIDYLPLVRPLDRSGNPLPENDIRSVLYEIGRAGEAGDVKKIKELLRKMSGNISGVNVVEWAVVVRDVAAAIQRIPYLGVRQPGERYSAEYLLNQKLSSIEDSIFRIFAQEGVMTSDQSKEFTREIRRASMDRAKKILSDLNNDFDPQAQRKARSFLAVSLFSAARANRETTREDQRTIWNAVQNARFDNDSGAVVWRKAFDLRQIFNAEALRTLLIGGLTGIPMIFAATNSRITNRENLIHEVLHSALDVDGRPTKRDAGIQALDEVRSWVISIMRTRGFGTAEKDEVKRVMALQYSQIYKQKGYDMSRVADLPPNAQVKGLQKVLKDSDLVRLSFYSMRAVDILYQLAQSKKFTAQDLSELISFYVRSDKGVDGFVQAFQGVFDKGTLASSVQQALKELAEFRKRQATIRDLKEIALAQAEEARNITVANRQRVIQAVEGFQPRSFKAGLKAIAEKKVGRGEEGAVKAAEVSVKTMANYLADSYRALHESFPVPKEILKEKLKQDIIGFQRTIQELLADPELKSPEQRAYLRETLRILKKSPVIPQIMRVVYQPVSRSEIPDGVVVNLQKRSEVREQKEGPAEVPGADEAALLEKARQQAIKKTRDRLEYVLNVILDEQLPNFYRTAGDRTTAVTMWVSVRTMNFKGNEAVALTLKNDGGGYDLASLITAARILNENFKREDFRERLANATLFELPSPVESSPEYEALVARVAAYDPADPSALPWDLAWEFLQQTKNGFFITGKNPADPAFNPNPMTPSSAESLGDFAQAGKLFVGWTPGLPGGMGTNISSNIIKKDFNGVFVTQNRPSDDPGIGYKGTFIFPAELAVANGDVVARVLAERIFQLQQKDDYITGRVKIFEDYGPYIAVASATKKEMAALKEAEDEALRKELEGEAQDGTQREARSEMRSKFRLEIQGADGEAAALKKRAIDDGANFLLADRRFAGLLEDFTLLGLYPQDIAKALRARFEDGLQDYSNVVIYWALTKFIEARGGETNDPGDPAYAEWLDRLRAQRLQNVSGAVRSLKPGDVIQARVGTRMIRLRVDAVTDSGVTYTRLDRTGGKNQYNATADGLVKLLGIGLQLTIYAAGSVAIPPLDPPDPSFAVDISAGSVYRDTDGTQWVISGKQYKDRVNIFYALRSKAGRTTVELVTVDEMARIMQVGGAKLDPVQGNELLELSALTQLLQQAESAGIDAFGKSPADLRKAVPGAAVLTTAAEGGDALGRGGIEVAAEGQTAASDNGAVEIARRVEVLRKLKVGDVVRVGASVYQLTGFVNNSDVPVPSYSAGDRLVFREVGQIRTRPEFQGATPEQAAEKMGNPEIVMTVDSATHAPELARRVQILKSVTGNDILRVGQQVYGDAHFQGEGDNAKVNLGWLGGPYNNVSTSFMSLQDAALKLGDPAIPLVADDASAASEMPARVDLLKKLKAGMIIQSGGQSFRIVGFYVRDGSERLLKEYAQDSRVRIEFLRQDGTAVSSPWLDLRNAAALLGPPGVSITIPGLTVESVEVQAGTEQEDKGTTAAVIAPEIAARMQMLKNLKPGNVIKAGNKTYRFAGFVDEYENEMPSYVEGARISLELLGPRGAVVTTSILNLEESARALGAPEVEVTLGNASDEKKPGVSAAEIASRRSLAASLEVGDVLMANGVRYRVKTVRTDGHEYEKLDGAGAVLQTMVVFLTNDAFYGSLGPAGVSISVIKAQPAAASSSASTDLEDRVAAILALLEEMRVGQILNVGTSFRYRLKARVAGETAEEAASVFERLDAIGNVVEETTLTSLEALARLLAPTSTELSVEDAPPVERPSEETAALPKIQVTFPVTGESNPEDEGILKRAFKDPDLGLLQRLRADNIVSVQVRALPVPDGTDFNTLPSRRYHFVATDTAGNKKYYSLEVNRDGTTSFEVTDQVFFKPYTEPMNRLRAGMLRPSGAASSVPGFKEIVETYSGETLQPHGRVVTAHTPDYTRAGIDYFALRPRGADGKAVGSKVEILVAPKAMRAEVDQILASKSRTPAVVREFSYNGQEYVMVVVQPQAAGEDAAAKKPAKKKVEKDADTVVTFAPISGPIPGLRNASINMTTRPVETPRANASVTFAYQYTGTAETTQPSIRMTKEYKVTSPEQARELHDAVAQVLRALSVSNNGLLTPQQISDALDARISALLGLTVVDTRTDAPVVVKTPPAAKKPLPMPAPPRKAERKVSSGLSDIIARIGTKTNPTHAKNLRDKAQRLNKENIVLELSRGSDVGETRRILEALADFTPATLAEAATVKTLISILRQALDDLLEKADEVNPLLPPQNRRNMVMRWIMGVPLEQGPYDVYLEMRERAEELEARAEVEEDEMKRLNAATKKPKDMTDQGAEALEDLATALEDRNARTAGDMFSRFRKLLGTDIPRTALDTEVPDIRAGAIAANRANSRADSVGGLRRGDIIYGNKFGNAEGAKPFVFYFESYQDMELGTGTLTENTMVRGYILIEGGAPRYVTFPLKLFKSQEGPFYKNQLIRAVTRNGLGDPVVRTAKAPKGEDRKPQPLFGRRSELRALSIAEVAPSEKAYTDYFNSKRVSVNWRNFLSSANNRAYLFEITNEAGKKSLFHITWTFDSESSASVAITDARLKDAGLQKKVNDLILRLFDAASSYHSWSQLPAGFTADGSMAFGMEEGNFMGVRMSAGEVLGYLQAEADGKASEYETALQSAAVHEFVHRERSETSYSYTATMEVATQLFQFLFAPAENTVFNAGVERALERYQLGLLYEAGQEHYGEAFEIAVAFLADSIFSPEIDSSVPGIEQARADLTASLKSDSQVAFFKKVQSVTGALPAEAIDALKQIALKRYLMLKGPDIGVEFKNAVARLKAIGGTESRVDKAETLLNRGSVKAGALVLASAADSLVPGAYNLYTDGTNNIVELTDGTRVSLAAIPADATLFTEGSRVRLDKDGKSLRGAQIPAGNYVIQKSGNFFILQSEADKSVLFSIDFGATEIIMVEQKRSEFRDTREGQAQVQATAAASTDFAAQAGLMAGSSTIARIVARPESDAPIRENQAKFTANLTADLDQARDASLAPLQTLEVPEILLTIDTEAFAASFRANYTAGRLGQSVRPEEADILLLRVQMAPYGFEQGVSPAVVSIPMDELKISAHEQNLDKVEKILKGDETLAVTVPETANVKPIIFALKPLGENGLVGRLVVMYPSTTKMKRGDWQETGIISKRFAPLGKNPAATIAEIAANEKKITDADISVVLSQVFDMSQTAGGLNLIATSLQELPQERMQTLLFRTAADLVLLLKQLPEAKRKELEKDGDAFRAFLISSGFGNIAGSVSYGARSELRVQVQQFAEAFRATEMAKASA